jgi:exoribonuclease R
LAKILGEKRRERGAIDFDFDEAKIILDDKGTITIWNGNFFQGAV